MQPGRAACLAILWPLFLGCASSPEPGASTDMQGRMAARQALDKAPPERAPAEDEPTITGEVPEELIAQILRHLSERTGADPAGMKVVVAESLTWADGSLGCPRPGMLYTQALVPGYRVVIAHQGFRYDYRASTRGHFFLCEPIGTGKPIPGGTPER